MYVENELPRDVGLTVLIGSENAAVRSRPPLRLEGEFPEVRAAPRVGRKRHNGEVLYQPPPGPRTSDRLENPSLAFNTQEDARRPFLRLAAFASGPIPDVQSCASRNCDRGAPLRACCVDKTRAPKN